MVIPMRQGTQYIAEWDVERGEYCKENEYKEGGRNMNKMTEIAEEWRLHENIGEFHWASEDSRE